MSGIDSMNVGEMIRFHRKLNQAIASTGDSTTIGTLRTPRFENKACSLPNEPPAIGNEEICVELTAAGYSCDSWSNHGSVWFRMVHRT